MQEPTLLRVQRTDQLAALLELAAELLPGAASAVTLTPSSGRCNALPQVHRASGCARQPGDVLRTPVPGFTGSFDAVAVCSCVLGPVPEPQRVLDDLEELLALRCALIQSQQHRIAGILPGVEGLLAARVQAVLVNSKPQPSVRAGFAELAAQARAKSPAETAWTEISEFAALAFTFESVCRSAAANRWLRASALSPSFLEEWLFDPATPRDPYRTLDEVLAHRTHEERKVLYEANGSSAALRLSWCGTLKLALAETDLVVCEVLGTPGTDLTVRGALAHAGVRVGAPFVDGEHTFGAYPEIVARWLGTSSRHRFGTIGPGPALLRRCGPLLCTPSDEDWQCASVLYREGSEGFTSFVDALDAAVLL